MIRIEHLRKEYSNIKPLEDVISVIDPSGTGKSTLLRCINMLEKPTDGYGLFLTVLKGIETSLRVPLSSLWGLCNRPEIW